LVLAGMAYAEQAYQDPGFAQLEGTLSAGGAGNSSIYRDENWTRELEVDEEGLRRYLQRKKHHLLTKSAAAELAYTLVPSPVSHTDGCLHFGDTVMLQSLKMDAYLHCDLHGDTRHTVSVAETHQPVARSVFALARGTAQDPFGSGPDIHFGQHLRLAVNPQLGETCYLACDTERPTGYHHAETEREPVFGIRVHIQRRAVPSTVWVLEPPAPIDRVRRKGEQVKNGASLLIRHVETGVLMGCIGQVMMNSYGAEYIVAGFDHMQHYADKHKDLHAQQHPPPSEDEIANYAMSRGDGRANLWSVVADTDAHPLSETLAVRKRQEDFQERMSRVIHKDNRELPGPANNSRNPDKRDGPSQIEMTRNREYEVCVRIYPILRARGLHGIRSFRRTCQGMDLLNDGKLPLSVFEGALNYLGIRFGEGESDAVMRLFGDEDYRVDYVRFLRLIKCHMPTVRVASVRDAYRKLQRVAGGPVTISHLERCFEVRWNREVQSQRQSEQEFMQEFLSQWMIDNAEGIVSWDDFLNYYVDVSLTVDDDIVFVELLRQCWNLQDDE